MNEFKPRKQKNTLKIHAFELGKKIKLKIQADK